MTTLQPVDLNYLNAKSDISCLFVYLLLIFFFKNKIFFQKNTTRVTNNLDLDQARRFVGPDLDPNCLYLDPSCLER